jgi:hypothetical protein
MASATGAAALRPDEVLPARSWVAAIIGAASGELMLATSALRPWAAVAASSIFAGLVAEAEVVILDHVRSLELRVVVVGLEQSQRTVDRVPQMSAAGYRRGGPA